MASIVIELQREALDRNILVSDLLRKALVVARKLGQSEFETWIGRELNGYRETDEDQPYRWAYGQVRAWNPARGWVPVVIQDTKVAEELSKRHCSQSIAEVETLLEGKSESGTFHMPYSLGLQQSLSNAVGYQTQFSLFLPPQPMVRILDAVRTIVLNWSLTLEKEGVLGEGMSFTGHEKESASRAPQSVANFYGVVHSPQVQVGTIGSTQVNASPDIGAVLAFLALLKDQLGAIRLPPEEEKEARSEVQTIEAQAKSPKPKPPIIRESLLSLRSILEKAGGAATGQLLVELGKLLF